MEEVIVLIDEWQASCQVSHCRICHEAEFESCRSLESPCACSGTVKYAHRDCIQRWCNEKGNTTCEICLQRYEPDYTAPSEKSHLIDAMTVRQSSGIQEQDPEMAAAVERAATDVVYYACTSAADRRAAYCRSLALTLTVILLMKHLLATLTEGTEDYPFSLVTILIIRASGILLPMFLVLKTIGAIQKIISRQYQDGDDEDGSSSLEDYEHQHRLL